MNTIIHPIFQNILEKAKVMPKSDDELIESMKRHNKIVITENELDYIFSKMSNESQRQFCFMIGELCLENIGQDANKLILKEIDKKYDELSEEN